MSQVNIQQVNKIMAKKPKLITSVRVNPERAEALRVKCLQLTLLTGNMVREPELVNWILDKYLDELPLDEFEKS